MRSRDIRLMLLGMVDLQTVGCQWTSSQKYSTVSGRHPRAWTPGSQSHLDLPDCRQCKIGRSGRHHSQEKVDTFRHGQTLLREDTGEGGLRMSQYFHHCSATVKVTMDDRLSYSVHFRFPLPRFQSPCSSHSTQSLSDPPFGLQGREQPTIRRGYVVDFWEWDDSGNESWLGIRI